MVPPNGYWIVAGGDVRPGDMYWHFHAREWRRVEFDMVGQAVVLFHGIARRNK